MSGRRNARADSAADERGWARIARPSGSDPCTFAAGRDTTAATVSMSCIGDAPGAHVLRANHAGARTPALRTTARVASPSSNGLIRAHPRASAAKPFALARTP